MVGEFQKKTPPVLFDSVLPVFLRARIGVPLVEQVIECERSVRSFRQFLTREGEVGQAKPGDACPVERQALAGILELESGKYFPFEHWRADVELAQMSGRIGQVQSGCAVPGRLTRISQVCLKPAG